MMQQPPPNMVSMQHRMPAPYGGPMSAPFGAAPFGMPPPGFQPFGGYGPPQGAWGMYFYRIFIIKIIVIIIFSLFAVPPPAKPNMARQLRWAA